MHLIRRTPHSRTENQPKEEVFGPDIADIRGSFARISRPNTLVRVLEILEKTSIWERTSMTRRRGRPRLQGIFKNLNFGQKNLGLNFRSLLVGQTLWPKSCPPPRSRGPTLSIVTLKVIKWLLRSSGLFLFGFSAFACVCVSVYLSFLSHGLQPPQNELDW